MLTHCCVCEDDLLLERGGDVWPFLSCTTGGGVTGVDSMGGGAEGLERDVLIPSECTYTIYTPPTHNTYFF